MFFALLTTYSNCRESQQKFMNILRKKLVLSDVTDFRQNTSPSKLLEFRKEKFGLDIN